MKNLYETIGDKAGIAAKTLLKHFRAAGINDWGDLNKAGLFDLRDEVLGSVAQSTARTIFAQIKAILRRFDESGLFCSEYASILVAKNEKSVATYLTAEELRKFEAVHTHTAKERMIKVQALISAYTGMRVSDISRVSLENVRDGYLTYTSQKTSVTATVPVSEKTMGWIGYAQEHKEDEPTLQARDRGLKRLCRKAGITEDVKIFSAGKERTVAKCDAISSHSFRRSFVTNLTTAGVPIADTSRMAGHTSVGMTERYICHHVCKVSPEAAKYLGI